MAATHFDPFSTSPTETISIIQAPVSPLMIGEPLGYCHTSNEIRGKAWKKLDIVHLPERLLHILCSRFHYQAYLKASESQKKKFFECLNFIMRLQKIMDDDSEELPVSEFQWAIENLATFLRVGTVNIDECLLDFVNQPDLFLKKLAEEGKSAVRKIDLLQEDEEGLSLDPSAKITDPSYGEETILLYRMSSRFFNFSHCCSVLMVNLLFNSLASSEGVGQYMEHVHQIVEDLKDSIPLSFQRFLINRFNSFEERRTTLCRRHKEKMKKITTQDFSAMSQIISSIQGVSDAQELKDKFRLLLPHSKNMQEIILRYIALTEEMLLEFNQQLEETSALLLIVLLNKFENKKRYSPDVLFLQFLNKFKENETDLRSELFRLPQDRRKRFLSKYLVSEKFRIQKMAALKKELELIELFETSIFFMEDTLNLYHLSHRYFLDRREVAISQFQLAEQIKRRSLITAARPSSLSRSREVCAESECLTMSSSSAFFASESATYAAPTSTVEEALKLATMSTPNKLALAALFNAITFLDDLFVELESIKIHSNQERSEHLDFLLVNLSLFVEQMFTFKMLEKIKPKTREEARPYLTHNLLSLAETFPDEIREGVNALAIDLNGVENCSRFFTSASSSKGRALDYLSAVHALRESKDSIACSDSVHQEIHHFVKEVLERSFSSLLRVNIRTEAWETRWEGLGISKVTTTPSSSGPSSSCSNVMTRALSPEEQEIFDNIDQLIGQCQFYPQSSEWIVNAERLLIQLRARINLTTNLSDFTSAHKRSAALICLIAWSLCIASAEKRGLINGKDHPSNFTKNLWVWVELLFGEEGAEAFTQGEKYFCDLSRSIYFRNRYQHNSIERDFPLWRIGCDSREEELSFITSSRSKQKLVTLQDGLLFLKRIFATQKY